MTAGGEKIQRYYVDRENVTPSHYGMGEDSRGEYVLYSDARAWVIAELKAMAKVVCPQCEGGRIDCKAHKINLRIAELEREGK